MEYELLGRWKLLHMSYLFFRGHDHSIFKKKTLIEYLTRLSISRKKSHVVWNRLFHQDFQTLRITSLFFQFLNVFVNCSVLKNEKCSPLKKMKACQLNIGQRVTKKKSSSNAQRKYLRLSYKSKISFGFSKIQFRWHWKLSIYPTWGRIDCICYCI